MSRKKNFLNLNEDSNSDDSSSEEYKNKKNNPLLKSSNYTISIESFDESNPKNSDKGNALSNINSENEESKEDLNDIIYQKENIIKFPNKYVKKQSSPNNKNVNDNNSFINRKKANPINKKTKIKISKEKKQVYDYKNSLNSVTIHYLNYYYKKLNDLVSQYSFSEIAQNIIKLFNNVDKDLNGNNKLLSKLKKIASKLDKETITMMSLSILSSKMSIENSMKNKMNESLKGKKETKNNNKNIINIKEEDDYDSKKKKEKIIDLSEENAESEDEEKEESDNIKAKNKIKKKIKQYEFINSFKNMPKQKYIFAKHYSNNKNIIYCYFSKTLVPRHSTTLYCTRNFDGCMAKCKIRRNTNCVKLLEKHNHDFGLSHNYFYEKFPFLKNKKWKHIQIVKEKKKNIVIYQC